ncbi:PREDICTED: zinc finger CCCH domain-containing protein 32 [Ipomoea nil]|uniref:zinc finger CCCH domain-containing protein 32 n=1 Tax=Ipomoea nil TaxID=35883 RepID=UPI00090114C4|nr:PREDICTED: zinc finger CCCH domain-containing protein 32 [Ipomoea nil]XP_019168490.1 PREDICTED: zinc finger CCCH domain-containing protein 32 [Ipomoea nil]
MEMYGRSTIRNGSQPDTSAEWAPVGPETDLEESMQRLGLWGRERYPERPGVPDCAYYIRTGLCGYGGKCRFNHPRDRCSVGAVQLGVGVYPERPGEPTCQYYLRTGTCKFSASCKFHHPRNAGGSLSNVSLNIYGYPLRPDEKECSYYLKTGQCKFALTCKYHHPQPAGVSGPAAARPFYPTVQSLPGPSTEQYSGNSANFRVTRPPLLPGSYLPSAYGPVLLHPGMVPVQNWSYSGPVSPSLSPGAQPSNGLASVYGISQMASSSTAFPGPYSPLLASTGPSSSAQNEKCFPERPGQPECQHYMKTGNCKFGSSCRYHHPPGWNSSNINIASSPLGLPLRPGAQPCSFYLQKGFCKFGLSCKFDHPMESTI